MKIDASILKAECKIDFEKFQQNKNPKTYIIDNTKYQQQRTQNPYHRPWESIRNYSKIIFPKFKCNNLILKLSNWVFKKYENQKIIIIRKLISKKEWFE